MTNGHAPIQLSMQRPELFQPVASSNESYVPVLQNLSGERQALRNAAEETWARMTPLIEIVGPKNPGAEPFKRSRVLGWVRKVADVVGARPFFLDTVRLGRLHRVGAASRTQPVLETILFDARRRGMNVVPVLKIQDGPGVRRALRRATGGLGTGIAVRYPLFSSAPGSAKTIGTVLKEALAAVELSPEAADLVIDLEFIHEDVEVEPDDLVHVLGEMLGIGEWRNVIMVGTSMPRSLGGGVVAEGSVGRLPRREWEVWQALRSRGPATMPTFGDYAVQHPDPPAMDESSGPGMRANIRYTVERETLIPRGRGPLIVEGSDQYRELCASIVESGGFAGESYSWGDEVIAKCARGGPTGNQSLWRGAGTSHHLTHVVDQLARVS